MSCGPRGSSRATSRAWSLAFWRRRTCNATKRRSEHNDGGAEGNDENRDGGAKCPFPRLDVALTLFGFCYDIFSVSLAVACMVVDVVVGVQLYQGGHTVWAWCVLGVFFDACAINAFLFVLFLHDSTCNTKATRSLRNMPRPLAFILLLQVSPFLVPIHWFAATYLLGHNSKTPPVVNLSSAATTRVAREEAAAVERSAFVIGRLGAALTKQESNYILLNAHALAEALPQFAVQLLAVSILGSPSPLQVASIVMSLVAVLSKVSFFCCSCSVEVFAIKLLFLCHDAFSLAYVVTTLLSRDDPTRTSELPFLHVMVSTLGYMWFVKEFLFVCTILLYSVGFLVGLFAAHLLRIRGWEISGQNLKEGFFVACFFVIAFVPGLLVLGTGTALVVRPSPCRPIGAGRSSICTRRPLMLPPRSQTSTTTVIGLPFLAGSWVAAWTPVPSGARVGQTSFPTPSAMRCSHTLAWPSSHCLCCSPWASALQ